MILLCRCEWLPNPTKTIWPPQVLHSHFLFRQTANILLPQTYSGLKQKSQIQRLASSRRWIWTSLLMLHIILPTLLLHAPLYFFLFFPRQWLPDDSILLPVFFESGCSTPNSSLPPCLPSCFSCHSTENSRLNYFCVTQLALCSFTLFSYISLSQLT